MSEPAQPANNLDELRRRCEEQPNSRAFLQLAEEYRRLGLPDEAIVVLEDGLSRRPNDLSGMVALGRLRLEIGRVEGAVEVLQTVISRDAAHLVANKLLIEGHLQQGDPDKAEQRLELYKLLNDRDPEIDHLEFRLKSMRRASREGAPVVEEASPLEAHELVEPMPAEAQLPGDVEVAASEPSAPPPLEGEIFALAPLPAQDLDALWRETEARLRAVDCVVAASEAAEPVEEIESVAPNQAAEPVEMAEPVLAFDAAETVEETVEMSTSQVVRLDEPFGGQALVSADDVEDRTDEAYDNEPATQSVDMSEPLIEPPAAAPPAEAPPAEAPPVIEDEPEPVLEDELAAVPEPSELTAEAAAQHEDVGATATLAELYLRQGHLEEAHRLYREVLERDPENAAARAALSSLETTSPTRLTADHLLAGLPAGEVPQGLTAKKVLILTAYLQRLRRRHVR